MSFYRLYFCVDGHIDHGHGFHAEGDDVSAKAAALVFDACSDRVDQVEVWSGKQLVAQMNASNIEAAIIELQKTNGLSAGAKALAVNLEETVSADYARFRSSARLHEKLTEAKRGG